MTTIAYKDGVLAADSQYTETDHVRSQGRPKIIKLPSGMILGSAGDVDDVRKAEDYLSDPNWEANVFKGRKKGIKEWEAIGFWHGKVLSFAGSLIAEDLGERFYAIGSGWEFALAALALGKSAEEAVKFAAEHDIYTGGAIQLAYLHDTEKQEKQTQAKRVRAKRTTSA